MFVRSLSLVSRPFVVLASRRVVAPRFVLSSSRFASTATATASSIRPQPYVLRHAVDANASSHSSTSTSNTDNTDSSSLPRFDSLKGHISDATLKAITVHPFQYTHMSPVQAEILPLLSSPSSSTTDLLVKAKTGTGKTLAFLVPAIESRLAHLSSLVSSKNAQSLAAGLPPLTPREERGLKSRYAMENVGTLVVSPTRELASQIAVEAGNLTVHQGQQGGGMGVQILLGGESKGRQMREWERGRKDIVVATPGRLLDLLTTEPGFKDAFKGTKLLVLDEADTLLDLGFRDDIDRIKTYLPATPSLQTFLFSATVSPAIQQIASRSLDPSHRFINCVPHDDSPVHAHIPQHYTIAQNGLEALAHVVRLIAHDQVVYGRKSKIIVFLPTTRMVQLLADLFKSAEFRKACLVNGGYGGRPSSAYGGRPGGRGGGRGRTEEEGEASTTIFEIHSKRTMAQRIRTSDAFRASTSSSSILLTSDVSARGVDYPHVTRVIQLGIPNRTDTYIHRVGRTGRGSSRVGRGDLVVAEWEGGRFVREKLADVPMKGLGVKEFEMELEEAFKAKSSSAEGETATGVSKFHSSTLHSSLTSILQTSTSIEAIKDTYAALLGFYAGNFGEQGIRRESIVDGLREWMAEMWGVERGELRVSSALLTKMGLGGSGRDARDRGFGGGGRRDGDRGFGGARGGGFGGRSSGMRKDGQRGGGEWGFERRERGSSGSFGERRNSFNFDRPSSGGGFGERRNGGGYDRERRNSWSEGSSSSTRSRGGSRGSSF